MRVEHVTCVGYCGQGPNAMVDGLPVSLHNGSLEKVIDYAKTGTDHGLTEPTNPIYRPADGKPCVLMRHFDKGVTGLAEAQAAGVYASLKKAVTTMSPQQVIDEIKTSQLRGRGGAGFPAGIKLQTVLNAESTDGRKFVVDNCDEGDAGSYIDKELMERDPHTQLEGVLLAAYACGAQEAILYIRFEYPRVLKIIDRAISEAKEAGIIGKKIFGSDFSCDVRIVKGQGAYICGEETSLLRSIEGVPAIVSFKPRSPLKKVCSAAPPRSTTPKRCTTCRGSSSTAAKRSRSSATTNRAARKWSASTHASKIQASMKSNSA